jgi:hypothetical protein
MRILGVSMRVLGFRERKREGEPRLDAKKLESHLFTPSSAHVHSSLVVAHIELNHATTHLTHSQIRTNAVALIVLH